MKYITSRIKIGLLLAFSAMMILSSCNKDVEQLAGPGYVAPSGLSLGETIAATPTDSLYYRMIVRAGLLSTVTNKSNFYTMFVPDNNAMKVFINAISGIPLASPDAVFAGFINTTLPVASANGIVSYNTCPQSITTANIPSTFPNFQYPSILNPAPSLSALLRLTTFPTTRNGNWLNNVPLTAVNAATANGTIHHTAGVVAPPSRYLWDRVNTDADLTILKAAITRADSGVLVTNASSLIGALQNIGANLTLFAPSNLAFKQVISALTGGVIPVGAPDATFIGFLGSNSISTQTVKGIVVYHILGYRVFANNFPTTATSYPTLLNGAIPTHPGVSIKCVFTGLSVTAATVKGVINLSASNIPINPTPDPGGTSDQHFLNGTLHKIDQVLLPQ
jgi:uncharacterized surface protein with fasciclin (FAS1) repeats